MSITKEITFWCDNPNCGDWNQVPKYTGMRMSELRKGHHAENGWVCRNGKDYCSKCAEEKVWNKDEN